jgi:dienelactone hydrolase
MKKQFIEYHDASTLLEGFCVYDAATHSKKPAVLIAHDWSGKNEFAMQKAEKLAALGYVGFALDMYGKGVTGKTTEEKSALIQPFVQDRNLLKQRVQAALYAVKTLEIVDATRIAAIGFCFGGMCVLDLARSGADINGVVSFHGLLQAPNEALTTPIKAKILALHGYDDPMVTPDHVRAFADEMTGAKADWQLHMYGHAKHAFANPAANDTNLGTVYNKLADQRSWQAMQNFLNEIFA